MNAEPLREKLATFGHIMPAKEVDEIEARTAQFEGHVPFETKHRLGRLRPHVEAALLNGDLKRFAQLRGRYLGILDGAA